MKKTHVRFIKLIGSKDKFKPFYGNESNHSLHCSGYETKTVTFEADTHDSQMNTRNYRLGLIKLN